MCIGSSPDRLKKYLLTRYRLRVSRVRVSIVPVGVSLKTPIPDETENRFHMHRLESIIRIFTFSLILGSCIRIGGVLGSVLAFSTKRYRLASFGCALLVAGVPGCALPPSMASIDTILAKEGRSGLMHYGYRCTSGAHRGASAEYKENTMAALKAAEEDKKYAFIEFDVQYSRDKKIVVYHDKSMIRLFGSMKRIGEATSAELSKLSGGEIVSYDEVIGLLQKKLNIEIKSQGDREEDERLVDEIVADIRARERGDDVLISSISSDVIRYVKRTYPGILTGQVFWLTASTYLRFDGLTKRLYDDINASHADYLMLHVANLRNIDALLKFKPRGKTIVFWDFDDSIYIVHRDLSDRLWGESGLRTFLQAVRYGLASPPDPPPGTEE